MGYWSLVIPEDTKNYVRNPSFETGTTGHAAFGAGAGTRTRVTTWQKRGIYSLEIVGTASPYGNVYANNTAGDIADFAVGDVVTFSLDLRVTAGTFRIVAEITGSGVANQTVNITAPYEGRTSIVFPAIAASPITQLVLYTYFASGTGTAYIDGLQIEKKAYATSYCDGDVEGCNWTGTPHNSKSRRTADAAIGGREYNLDDLGYYVTGASGIGMPPLSLITQVQTLLPGTFLRDYSVGARTINLTAQTNPTSQSDLHSKRKAFIDAIKPDRTGNYKPFLLQYTGANASKKIGIEVVYDTGMEYNAPPTGFAEAANLRFIAPEPFWRESGNVAFSLNTVKSLTTPIKIAGKEEGEWTRLGTDLTGAVTQVNVIKRGADGLIYVGGEFASASGVAGTAAIAVWNPESNTWSSLGGGATGANPAVYDIVFDSLGNVYVCGFFTAMNAVASTQHIAKYDKATAAWVSITPGAAPNAAVYALALSSTGILAATGQFTSIGGGAFTRIAYYNGSAWGGFGSGLNSDGLAIAYDSNDVLYVGGAFTSANAVTVNYVTYWNGTTFVSMGVNTFGTGGVNNTVFDILFTRDGTLYITGDFTQTSVRTVNRIAYWTGVEFLALDQDNSAPSIGLNGTGVQLAEDDSGNIWVVGAFTSAGGETTNAYITVWTGMSWEHSDALPNSTCRAIAIIDNETMYFGHGGTSALPCSELTTVTYTGTRQAYPTIQITRSGGTSARIRWIENLTNDSVLWLNHALLDGETLTIDLTPGDRDLSSSRFGTVWKSISPASKVSNFCLQPGANRLKVFVESAGSPTITAFMLAENTYWSVDGVAT